MSKRYIVSTLCVAMMGAQLGTAQTPGAVSAPSAPASIASPAPSGEDLRQLRETIAQQEEQIKRLQQAVDEQQKVLERSLAASEQASKNATAAAGTTVATSNAPGDTPVQLIPAVGGTGPLATAAKTAGSGQHDYNDHAVQTRHQYWKHDVHSVGFR